MKLALLHPQFGGLGGAELLLASHAGALREAGHAVSLVTFGYDPSRWESFFPGVEVSVMPRATAAQAAREIVRSRMPRRVSFVSGELQRVDASIAYNYPSSAALGLSRSGARRIWHCCEPPRDLYPFETNPTLTARLRQTLGSGPEHATREFAGEVCGWLAHAALLSGRRRAKEDRRAVAAIPEIWALSEFSRACVRRVHGAREVEVVYPMVRFPAARPRQSGLAAGGLSVLCHSRLTTVKNIDTVLRGFALFRGRREGSGARLAVVGEGPARKKLEALARRLELGDAVKFHGFLPDEQLERVYAACDVFASLPLDEPFGMVFPEAAARGLLIIGPDHGGPVEILDHGRHGWSVDAFEPEALAEALCEVSRTSASDVDRRREEADRVFRDRFGRETIGARLEALLARG